MLAELGMAGVYLRGDGVSQDYAEAAHWFRRAAEHGAPIAYLYLAQLEEKGLAGPSDPLEAYEGYSIALTWLQGQHGPANVTDVVAKHRDEVAAKLTPEQKTRADEFVRQRKRAVH